MKTKLTKTTTEPSVIELQDPDNAGQVMRLIQRMEIRREDDTPEESAIRMSAMALMLSNIAAPHLVAKVGDCELDLGVGFAVEGGFLRSDIEATVIEPAFRIQQLWERNLVHEGIAGDDAPKENTQQFYDRLLLPAHRVKALFMHQQKKRILTDRMSIQAEEKAQGEGNKKTSNTTDDPKLGMIQGECDFMILRTREQTRYREVLDYRVFIAEGNNASGLEKRAVQAHLGRFVMNLRIDTPECLARAGRILADYTRHRNIRRGEATLMLRADPVVTVGPNVLSQSMSPDRNHPPAITGLLWLVESAVGCDLPESKVRERFKAPTSNFQTSCELEIGRRINFTDARTHELPEMEDHLGEWRQFLREREQKFPGIAAAIGNLPVALCYGLESLRLHQYPMDGGEVLALAKWLVIRMCNRFAVATTDERPTRVQQLASKLAGKLLEHGPLTVRELTRKCSRLKADDCQDALQWLADRRIAAVEGTHWGIKAKSKAVRELLG